MANLVSINIGQPEDVEWSGRTVRTSIWKRPVQGRRYAARLNLEGDGQADLIGHGGEQRAVLVYQLDSYRYWQTFLGRDDFEYGQFGENLTVEGLPDSDVCIGDRYEIGTAVFEVSQPRVTCYKVGIRLGRPDMPALLVSHERPGFYMRVIQEGWIVAGDEIRRITVGPEAMNVVDVDRLLYASEHPVEKLTRILKVNALSPGWRVSFEELLRGHTVETGSNPGLPVPAWTGFKGVRLAAKCPESTDVTSFVFESADGSTLGMSRAGQHIAIKLAVSPTVPAIIRSYSLSGPPSRPGFRISVKREDEGAGSKFLHDHVNVGDVLEISAPRGDFLLRTDELPIVLISAGIGITPLLAMLYAEVAARVSGLASREVWWVHAARDSRHHAFATEVQSLLDVQRDIRRSIIYSQPRPGDRERGLCDYVGRVNADFFAHLGPPPNAHFYLCGPTKFLRNVTQLLVARGVPVSAVHQETFGGISPSKDLEGKAMPHRPEGPPGSGPLVTFTRSSLAVPWDDRFANLLEFAEACSVEVSWSCRAGVCHRCESGLFEGEVLYSTPPLDPPPLGFVLLCCSKPITNIQLEL